MSILGAAKRALSLVLASFLLAASLRAAAPEPAVGAHAMVVAPHPEAARAGLALLSAGGNAVDAAVAASFALAVVQPQSTGIGGGAFLLLREADGDAFALDARETAPARATPEAFQHAGREQPSVLGGLAVGTPGFVSGLALAVERFGTKPLGEVLAPAIRLAEQGYEILPYQRAMMEKLAATPLPRAFPDTARIQLAPVASGEVARGSRLVQPELAATLRAIAAHGPRAFYEGAVAEAIAKSVAEAGGVLDVADLAAYRPVVREPLRGTYRDYELVAFPPPSSGGVTLLEALNVLEGFDLRALGAGSSAGVHRVAEALKFAFADRAQHLGDPDHVAVPVGALLDKTYAARLRERMTPPFWREWPWRWGEERAVDVPGSLLAVGDHGTAHVSVVDAAGSAAAITGTINGPYGSWVTAKGTGILLNNEMDDFVTDPSQPNRYGLPSVAAGGNLVAPGKRPLSSMAPLIALRGGRLAFVAGSNGGPVIITSVLEAFLNVADFDMDVSEAVSAPRFHHQWRPDELVMEAAHPADVVEALRARGHVVRVVDEITSGVQAIAIDPRSGARLGASDPRRDGLALGN